MKKQILTLLFTCACTCCAYSQFELQSSQKFHWPVAPMPLIGLDYLRVVNPEIILQRRTGFNSADFTYTWQNQNKFNTIHDAIGGNVFSELGIYDFDTLLNKWTDNWVDHYTFDYNYTLKTMKGFTLQRGTPDSMQNQRNRTRYTFDSMHLADSEYFEIWNAGQYEPQSSTAFIYDSLLRVCETKSRTGNTFFEHLFYQYDSMGRLLQETALTRLLNGPTDSSSIKTYTYDSAGRMTACTMLRYKMPNSPYTWTISQQTIYGYDMDGQLTSAVVSAADPTQNYKLVPLLAYNYSYTATGKIAAYLQTDYDMGMVSDRLTFSIDYDASDNATEALAYAWNGAGFDLLASYRFLFSQTPGAAIRKTALNNKISLFPNPCRNELHIGNYKAKEIRIADITGKEVIILKDTDTIQTEALSPGVYILKMDAMAPLRLIKE